MAVKIKSIKNIVKNNGLKILIHGMAGAGKTVMCCTTGEPTLIISAEAGLLSVKDAPDYIKGAEIESIDDLDDIFQYLKEDAPDFKWVALDSITEIAERVLSTEKKLTLDPRKAYQALSDRMIDYVKDFRDLKDYNIVMSCKSQVFQDEDGKTLYMPLMPGKQLHKQIPYLFDEVFALYVEKDEDGDDVRIVQTGRDRKYEAKDRSGMLDMYEEPNLKSISKKIRGDGDEEKKSTSTKKKKRKIKKEKLEEKSEESDDIKNEEIEDEDEFFKPKDL